MNIIEKTKDNAESIEVLYEYDNVIFEHTILRSDNLTYSICYTPRLNIYDIIIEDNKNGKIINYESRNKLSGSTLKYFNMYKGDTYSDGFNNNFKCIKHVVEYII